jgi:hypothetical protein
MNNTETLSTSDTQDTGQNKNESKQKGRSRMNNTETLTTSDIQDTGQNKHLCLVYPMLTVSLSCSFLIVPSVYSSVYCVLCLVYLMIKNEQDRDTDNIRYTRHRTK